MIAEVPGDAAPSLYELFLQTEDPRARRGVRHPVYVKNDRAG